MKVKMDLEKCSTNAFSILGVFIRSAKSQNFSKGFIDSVVEQAKSGDYDHLIQTIMEHIE